MASPAPLNDGPNIPSGYEIPNGAMNFGNQLNVGEQWVDNTISGNTRYMEITADGLLVAYNTDGKVTYSSGGATPSEPDNSSKLPSGKSPGYAVFGSNDGYGGNPNVDGDARLKATFQLFTSDKILYWSSHDTIQDVPGDNYFASESYFYLDDNGFPCIFVSENDPDNGRTSNEAMRNSLYHE